MSSTVREACDPDDVLDAARQVDLSDPRLYATERPERIWRTFRRAGVPVFSRGLRDHWAITGHAQVREVLRHSDQLSSAHGNHLGEKPSDVAASAAAAGLSLLVSDGERHAQMRRALGVAFTPRAMARLVDSTRALTRRLVADAVGAGPVDFVEAVATPLPAIVVCDLLGVPPGDRPLVVSLTRTAFGGSGHVAGAGQVAAHTELLSYCDELVAARRRTPRDDVASVLAAAEIDGRPLSRSVAVMNCHDLIAGGNETARHVSSAALLTMVTDPGFWSELKAGRADPDVATDEILRRETPVSHMMRRLVGDLRVGGTTLPAGDYVTLWLRSANRDETVFEAPGTLWADRRPNPHLGFGLGPHYCIAALLARIEVGAVVRALAELVDRVELTAEPVRIESNFFRGHRSVAAQLIATTHGSREGTSS